jgi:hypothetical protein
LLRQTTELVPIAFGKSEWRLWLLNSGFGRAKLRAAFIFTRALQFNTAHRLTRQRGRAFLVGMKATAAFEILRALALLRLAAGMLDG